MGPIVVEDIRDRSYDLLQVRIGNEGDSDNSGTGRNKTHFTASRKTEATAAWMRSGFSELIILSPASFDGRGVFFCPLLSGHYGFVLVYWHGLKDFEDRHGGAVRYRATISAYFGRKVPILPFFSLDASDHFSYHLLIDRSPVGFRGRISVLHSLSFSLGLFVSANVGGLLIKESVQSAYSGMAVVTACGLLLLYYMKFRPAGTTAAK